MNWSEKFFIFLITALCASCNIDQLDFDNVAIQDITPEIALPLGSISYTIEELLEEINDSTVTIGADNDQVVILTFSDSASFSVGEELVEIMDVTGTGMVSPGIAATATTETITIPFEETFEFVYDDQLEDQLDSVFYNGGTVSVDVTSSCQCSFTYEFIIENTRDVITDERLTFNGDVPFTGSIPVRDVQARSLENQKTTLNDDNTFRSFLRGELTLAPGQSVTPADEISFEFTYANQTFDAIFGFFGQDTVTITAGRAEIEFFENANSEGILLSGPNIEFEFNNGFGVPIGVIIDEVFGVNNQEDTISLSGELPDEVQVIAFNRENIGEPERTSFVVTPDNSNVRDLFASAPRFFEFPITGISNFGNTDGFNYLLADSKIDTKLNFTLPLRFRLNNFEQSFDFDIEEGLNVDEIESFALQLVTNNTIPFVANMDLTILDNADQVIFDAIETLVIAPPTFGSSGNIIQNGETTSLFDLGVDGTAAIKDASKVNLRIVLNSPSSNENEFFNLLITNGLDVQVSVIGTAKVEL